MSSLDNIKRFIVSNHQLSEGVVSNLQMLFTFVPGRWTEWEVAFESAIGALNALVLVEDLVVHEHLRRRKSQSHVEGWMWSFSFFLFFVFLLCVHLLNVVCVSNGPGFDSKTWIGSHCLLYSLGCEGI